MSHLQLFPMPNVEDIRRTCSTGRDLGGRRQRRNLCAVGGCTGWIDPFEAWQAGVVLSAPRRARSAARRRSTDSFGVELRGFTDGLGWLPYSNGCTTTPRAAASDDAQADRRRRAAGRLRDHDGAGLVLSRHQPRRVVADSYGPLGYELKRAADGS